VTSPARRPRWPAADLPGRRLFVAVPLPAEATANIAALVDAVRRQGVPDGGRDVRWVRLDGLHLTLRFIGPTPDDRVDAARDAVLAAAGAVDAFDISIGGAGSFPPFARPRALWLGLREGGEPLSTLAHEVDQALIGAGWALDEKPFRAHLTLARSDGVPAGGAIAQRLVAAAADFHARFRAERMGLFESLTGGGPARYEPIETVDLG
jgi:2'-5' RNA ligase